MIKISGKVIKFIKNIEENWRVELTIVEKSLTKVKLQEGNLKRDWLPPLLFVIAMLPVNHILGKCIGWYKLHKLQGKSTSNVHGRYQTICQKWERNGNPITGSKNIIIIIMSCRQHGYPWPSLATPPDRSSLLAGLQGYIPYPLITAVSMFEQAVLLLFGHMSGSIGVYHLWARPCFSSMSASSNLDNFLLWEASGRIVGALWGVASMTCPILLAAFLCIYSPDIGMEFTIEKWKAKKAT